MILNYLYLLIMRYQHNIQGIATLLTNTDATNCGKSFVIPLCLVE